MRGKALTPSSVWYSLQLAVYWRQISFCGQKMTSLPKHLTLVDLYIYKWPLYKEELIFELTFALQILILYDFLFYALGNCIYLIIKKDLWMVLMYTMYSKRFALSPMTILAQFFCIWRTMALNVYVPYNCTVWEEVKHHLAAFIKSETLLT